MADWESYWNQPEIIDEDNVFVQIQKTVNKKPITPEQFRALIDSVVEFLRINDKDTVLDLCCGNGVVTQEIAKVCGSVVGVDFSMPLLRVARDRFSETNIQYIHGNVTSLPDVILGTSFTKIFMNEALQHLSLEETDQMLGCISRSKCSSAPILFSAVPDKEKIWSFYDTDERREEYIRRIKDGTEAIGHWWDRAELEALAERYGYQAQFKALPAILHSAKYRFDVLLTK